MANDRSFPPDDDHAPNGSRQPQDPHATTILPAAFQTNAFLRIRDYRLVRVIGKGGMGVVYLAYHERLDREVAIKLLNPAILHDAEASSRFERESKILGRLRHENLVQATDAGEANGSCYLVMEYVEGENLSSIVNRLGPLNVAAACEIGRQTAVALEYIHQQHLVHRDIKPSNLMLSVSGQVKLLDMGLARVFDAVADGKQQMTGSQATLGTLDFMAPEQFGGSRAVDIRADIYALGATLYQLLAGHPPFGTEEFTGMQPKMKAVLFEAPKSIGALRSDLPPEVAEIITRSLAKSPEERFKTPQELADRLSRFASVDSLRALTRQAFAKTDQVVPEPTREEASATSSVYASDHRTVKVDAKSSPPVPANPLLADNDQSPPRTWLKWLAMGGLAAVLLGVIIIVITNKDGTKTTIEVPDGSKVDVKENGKTIVSLPAEKPVKPLVPSLPQVNSELLKGATPILVEAGQPLGIHGIVSRPAPIAGLRSWSIEMASPFGYPNSMASHPRGEWIASQQSMPANIHVWDSKGTTKQVLFGGDDGMYQTRGLAVLDDGRLLASVFHSGGKNTCVQIWDTATWACLKSFEQKAFSARAVTWSPKLKKLAVVGAKSIWIVDPILGFERSANFGFQTAQCDFSPDGKFLVVANETQQTVAWELLWLQTEDLKVKHRQELKRAADGTAFPCRDLAFSPDGRWVASTGGDGIVRIWDGATAELRHVLKSNAKNTMQLQWFRDSRRLAVVNEGGDGLAIWNLDQPEEPVVKLPSGKSGLTLQLSHDEKTAIFSGSGTLYETPVEAASIRPFSVPLDHTTQSVLSADGKEVATLCQGTLTLWDAESGIPQQAISRVPFASRILRSNSGDYFAGYDEKKSTGGLFLVHPKSAEVISLVHTSSVDGICWSPDSNEFVTCGPNRTLDVWNAESRSIVRQFAAESKGCFGVVWSPNGMLVSAVDSEGNVKVFDSKTGECVKTRIVHHDQAMRPYRERMPLAWSGNSNLWVAPITAFCKWNIDSDEITKLQDTYDSISALTVSPDGDSVTMGAPQIGILRNKDGEVHRLGWCGQMADWCPDNSRAMWHTMRALPAETKACHGYDMRGLKPLGTLFTNIGDTWVVISADGHYRGGKMPKPGEKLGDGTTATELANLEEQIVYAALHEDGSRACYTPSEFRTKFGWQNEPHKATLLKMP